MKAGKPQLIIVLREDSNDIISKSKGIAGIELTPAEQGLLDLLEENQLVIRPLFNNPAPMKAVVGNVPGAGGLAGYAERFCTVQLKAGKDPAAVKNVLAKMPLVEAAYFKPASEPPVFLLGKDYPGKLKASGSAQNITEDHTLNQTYLDPAPGGLDARFAWTLPGGTGTGITIIDVEGGWNFDHEDLQSNSSGLLQGFNYTTEKDWFQHGTAVLGIAGGDPDSRGISGICPDAALGALSIFGTDENDFDTARAIADAVDKLEPGDILLLEQHRPGPASPEPMPEDSQLGYIGLEWWPCDFLAIQYATAKGIIVIEAAGNGSQDLNGDIHNSRPEGFPEWWTNPFNRGTGMDSGAILVGAGAPPPGTNGEDWGPARSRLDFSNYGSCIDAQGWGRSVTTAGYGDVHGNDKEDMKQWYTHSFSGTSSASPMVTGVAACLQGILLAAGRALLTPGRMRELLRANGSPQQAGSTAPVAENIGRLPDLRQLAAAL